MAAEKDMELVQTVNYLSYGMTYRLGTKELIIFLITKS